MEEKGGQAAGDKVSQSMNRPSATGAVIEGVEGHRFLQKLSQSLVCMCVCMCIYIYICVCVYIYIYTHTYIQAPLSMEFSREVKLTIHKYIKMI